MFCKNCGNQIDDNSAFCSKCGTAVSAVPPQTAKPVPAIEKAPEYGKRITSTENLDPYFQAVSAAIKILRWILCIGLIYIFLGEYSVIVLIIVIVLSVKLSKAAANFILHAYEMVRGAKLIGIEYSSYINTKNAELITSVLMTPMLLRNIKICVGTEPHVIDILYCDRKYAAGFSTEPGGSFRIMGSDFDFSEQSYANMCSDVPVIAFYLQDVLRNL